MGFPIPDPNHPICRLDADKLANLDLFSHARFNPLRQGSKS
jgi:hypothetical protein